jgi:hypothetical protein
MLRILLIIFLVGYVLYKISNFFFKVMYASAAKHQADQQEQGESNNGYAKRPADGNVNIDFVPKGDKIKNTSKGREGDYVDYEEVK